MKKALTAPNTTTAVSEPWRAPLRTFDADPQRRGAADRTRRAYGTDAAELAAWATANGLNPVEVDYKVLRRWAARLSQRGAAPRTMVRKLASIRSLFRSLLEHGEVASNPADLLPAPRLPPTPPPTLQPAAGAAPAADAADDAQAGRRRRAAGAHPGLDAARAARSRALRAGLLERAARRG